jgi:hypothetical protein
MVNAFLAVGLLVIIVMVVYLVDRVNSLEKETKRVASMASHTAPSAQPQDPWSGLSGKALWDAMTGRPPVPLSESALQELRARYEVVLQKHIQSLFDEGVRDGQLGVSGEPKNPRTIATAAGPVESWMPAPQANTLYKCGLDSVQLSPDALQPVRQALDEAGQQLFAKTQYEQSEPLSQSLMPMAAPAPAAANGQTLAQSPSAAPPGNPL